MTDKERLEEIKRNVSKQVYDRLIVPKTKVTIDYKDYKYLYEQAKQVQELESRIADDEHFVAEILEQNKRYREVIEKIKKTSDDYRAGHLLDIQDSFFVDEIIAIINNLEGEYK